MTSTLFRLATCLLSLSVFATHKPQRSKRLSRLALHTKRRHSRLASRSFSTRKYRPRHSPYAEFT